MTEKLLGALEPEEFDDLVEAYIDRSETDTMSFEAFDQATRSLKPLTEDEIKQLSEAELVEHVLLLETERARLEGKQAELEAELQSLHEELLELLEEQERHPDLEIIKAVLGQGQTIVPALIVILENDDYYGGADAIRNIWTPVHAANILCELRAIESLPALRRAMTRPDEDGMAEWISEGLVKFGPAALDTAEAILRDKTVQWYPRALAAETLKAIAQHYPETYERVTATMRGMLPEPAIDFSKYESYEQVKAELDDPQIWESLVSDLCDLQDPQAYDLIASMFDRGLISEVWMGRDNFEEAYARPTPRPPRVHPEKDLLTMYRELRPRERPQPAPPPRPVTTAGQPGGQPMRVKKIGRNAPCPCGSGKKYKHCHGRRGAPPLPA
ncbi:MAG: SEC-C metal-binding domain-containing protein [Anaerolineae bacterium]